jgi:hypothetical protein
MYNTTLGAAVQAIVGPFHFPDLTVQVYPLLADPAVLAAYVDTQLNTPLKKGGMRSYDLKDMDGNWSFELFGSYVYMIINSYGDQKGEMWSAADNIGSFFKREVSFCIPVKWKDDQGKLVTVALIEPFVYSNDGRAVATDREVNGYNSIRASIESPPDTWLSPSGPVASRAYLKMGVEVFPALNVGQKAQQRTLLEIDGRPADASTDAGSPSEDVIAWNRELIDDLMRKSYLSKAKATEIDIVGALSREILGNGAPLNRLVIKQYRDSAQLDRACYQALIHLTTSISTIYDMREIETPVHIRLHRHPGHELADALGLKIKSSQSVAGEVIDTLAPVRPFWARLAIKEDLGTVACYRPEDSRWRITHPWFAPPEPDATPPPPSPTDDDVAAVDISVNPPPPRRLTGQRPYFRKFWTTGVGPALAPGSRGWGERVVGLRSENARWLRSSLVNDLAWLRVQCEGGVLAGPALAELRSKLSATDSGASGAAVQQSLARLLGRDVQADGLSKQLDALLDANPLAEFCDGLSTHELSKLLHALHAAVGAVLGHVIPAPQGVAPEKPSKTSADARVVAFSDDLARVHAWLHKICADADKHANAEVVVLTFQGLLRANAIRQSFADIIDAFERAPELNQKAMLSVFPRSTRELLAELGDFTLPRLAATPSENVGVLFDNMNAVSNNIDRAERLGMICREAFAPWATPSAWLRIVHGPNSPPVEGLLDACSAVDGLDEVQLVIDRILSARWEDRGLPAVMPPEFLRASEELGPAALERGLRAEPPASDAPASTVWVDTSL